MQLAFNQWVEGSNPSGSTNIMKRIIRKERVTPEQAARDKEVRKRVEKDLPELIARHEKRLKERAEKDNGELA